MSDAKRKCPFCAEEIPIEALRCRYCRSRVVMLDPEGWHRDLPERRIAGVGAALARVLLVPAGVVRVGFIVLTFFHLLGLVVYAALWLIIPFSPKGPSPLERAIAWFKSQLSEMWGDPASRSRPTGDGTRREGGSDLRNDLAPLGRSTLP